MLYLINQSLFVFVCVWGGDVDIGESLFLLLVKVAQFSGSLPKTEANEAQRRFNVRLTVRVIDVRLTADLEDCC